MPFTVCPDRSGGGALFRWDSYLSLHANLAQKMHV
jgi:hypothetical protein